MVSGEIAQAIREVFGADPDVAAVYVFGSVARGTARAGSDVDVGVLYTTPPAPTLLAQPFAAEADLTAKLGRAVQVVVMNGAPVDLIHRILRDGALVIDRDPSARIAFEVRARNEYFDLLPILRRYRRGHARP